MDNIQIPPVSAVDVIPSVVPDLVLVDLSPIDSLAVSTDGVLLLTEVADLHSPVTTFDLQQLFPGVRDDLHVGGFTKNVFT